VLSVLWEVGGNSFEYHETAGLSGKARVHFDERIGLLQIPDLLLRGSTIDFSFPVWIWRIRGTLEALKVRAPYSYSFFPAVVDPSDGSFTTFLELDTEFVLSAEIAGSTLIEDEMFGWYFDPFPVSGTLMDAGDSDADGLSEYAITIQGPISLTFGWGEVPPLGEIAVTITGELNLGFVAEVLSPDRYEEDNLPHDAQALLPGEVQTRVIHPDGDVDWIKVSALDGYEYTVETLDLIGSWPDTILEVYDDSGTLVTMNDDVDYVYGRYEFRSRVSWPAAYTGTYYVKARSWGGSADHFDDQGGGPAFCSYEIAFPCSDLDGDGYGDPGCVLCTYAEADCDDEDVHVNPGAKEGPPWDPSCRDGLDNDCNGSMDGADHGCQYTGVANAEASVYGKSSLSASGTFNSLALFLIPVGALFFLKIGRRKRDSTNS
jgi:hypothetical protein